MIRAFIEKCAAKMTDDCSEPVLLSDEDSEPVLINLTQGSLPVVLNFSRDDFKPKLFDFSVEESEPGIISTTSTPKKVAEATLQTGTYPTMASRADLELSGGSAGPSYLCLILQHSGLTLEENSSGKQ